MEERIGFGVERDWVPFSSDMRLEEAEAIDSLCSDLTSLDMQLC